MKIAIVCDDLIQKGGAEKVIFTVLNNFQDANLYSSVISNEYKKKLENLNVNYKTSFLQNFLFITKLYKFYSIFYLHQMAFMSFDFTKYDLVISFSARYSHLINTKPNSTHICYMHTPPRMFYRTRQYFQYEKFKYFKFLIIPFLILSRITDYIYAQKINYFIANSKNAQNRILKIYNKKSEVINPSIDTTKYYSSSKSKDYFLVISRLVPWKNIDLIIETFTKHKNLNLKIIGDGSYKKQLRKMAKNSKNIEFLGYLPEDTKIQFISNAIATIQAHEEDFGLVPVESLACGTPVVAYKKGGVLEVITNEKLGVLYKNNSVKDLHEALLKAQKTKYDYKYLINHAKKYDDKIFISNLKKYINKVTNEILD